MSTEGKKYLRPREAAEYLNVSYSWFRRDIQPQLPKLQRVPGGLILFNVTDLDAWMAANRREPASPRKW